MDEPRGDWQSYPWRLDLPDHSELAHGHPGKLPDGRKPAQLFTWAGVSECRGRATRQGSEPQHRSAVSRAEPEPVLQHQRILVSGGVYQWQCGHRYCALWRGMVASVFVDENGCV